MKLNFFKNEKEYPLLTHTFVNYFSNKKLNDKILVEIGSGESTLYWEKKFKKVISYENDKNYYQKILNSKTKNNTEINLYDKNIFQSNKFLNDIKSADYIIIDNNPNFISRYEFSVFCRENMKKDCGIILDNGTWNLEAYSYLLNNFFVKEFPGKNKNSEVTVTSIFEPLRDWKYYHYTVEK